MMPRVRNYCLVGLLMAAGVVFCFAWKREPVYQGKKLSAWLQILGESQKDNETSVRAWEETRRTATQAVQAIGAEALPWLLRWAHQDPGSIALRAKVDAFLDKIPFLNLQLPERRDSLLRTALGFKALGQAASPALPALGKMLLDPKQCGAAVDCLRAIGPSAVGVVAPALTHPNLNVQWSGLEYLIVHGNQIGPAALPLFMDVMTNRNCRFHAEAMIGLGNLGLQARELKPWIESVMRDARHPLSGEAMRVITQVSDRPQEYATFFSEGLADKTLAPHAAFALSQLGVDGLMTLLKGLTSEQTPIRSATYLALDQRMGLYFRPPAYSFCERSYRFDGQFRVRETSLLRRPELERFSCALRIAEYLGQSEPGVRLQIVELLGSYGHLGAAGLSEACLDADERVRKAAQLALDQSQIEAKDGALVRGPKNQRRMALVFTGHEYAEGGDTILAELARHKAQASFFLTGDFLANASFETLIERVRKEGHYLGPHSDKHLLYCSWEAPKRTLLTPQVFSEDFGKNIQKLPLSAPLPRSFIPPYEHYNLEIVKWASRFYYITVNLTPGTRSAADYTGEGDTNFVSSQAILESIIAREREGPNGLNGFILLLHLGSGPARKDKFHLRFGELLDHLVGKGYEFVAVDELFQPGASQQRKEYEANEGAIQAFRRRYGLGQ